MRTPLTPAGPPRPPVSPVRAVALLAVLLLAPWAGAQVARALDARPLETAPGDLQQNLQALESEDASDRRAALIWLAQHGTADHAGAAVPLLKDPDHGVRALAQRALWEMWARSGEPEVDRLMERGIGLMARGELPAAVAVFGEVVQQAPDFAEGYNKRATVLFQLDRYEASLADVNRTLQRNPRHFGALSGGALCLLALGRPTEALVFMDRAVAINPNMERLAVLADRVRQRLQRRQL